MQKSLKLAKQAISSRFSSMSDVYYVKQNIERKSKISLELLSVMFGGIFGATAPIATLIFYLDNKSSQRFTELEKHFKVLHTMSTRTEEKINSLNSNVEIYSNQVIRAEIRAEIKDAEIRKEMKELDKNVVKRWW
jgi:hypothetical protein